MAGERSLHRFDNDVVKDLIHSGMFIKVRRKIWMWSVIYEHHPNAQFRYQSLTARLAEQKRHILLCRTNSTFVLHPYSKFSFYWEFFILFAFVYMTLVYVLDDMDLFREYFQVNLLKGIGDVLFLLDIILHFHRGYYDAMNSRTVLIQRLIAVKYAKSYFLVDLIAIVPSFSSMLGWLNLVQDEKTPLLKVLSVLGVVRLLRMPRWLGVLDTYKAYRNYPQHITKAVKTVFIYVICLCVSFSTMMILMNNIYSLKGVRLSFTSVRYLWATVIILLISNGLGHLDEFALMNFVYVLFNIAGFLLVVYLYSEIFKIWHIFLYGRNKYHNNFQEIQQYLHLSGVSKELREKINRYVEIKFQRKSYNINTVNYLVSNNLRRKILLHLAKKYLGSSEIIKNLPDNLLYDLTDKFRSDTYLADDVIIKAEDGKKNTSIYFIYIGTVAVYDVNGKEICHLEDGESFGEGDELFSNVQVGKVVAVCDCEIFYLKRRFVIALLKNYPRLMSFVRFRENT